MNDDIANYHTAMLVNSRDSIEDTAMKLLSNYAQKVPLEKAIKQQSLRSIYKCHLLSSIAGINGHLDKRIYLVRQHNFNNSARIKDSDPIPRYVRTRRVAFTSIACNGKMHIAVNCDCGYVRREYHVCRHIQSIVDSVPSLESFHPKCHKAYIHFMNVSAEYTKIVEQYDKMFLEHQGLIFSNLNANR